MAKRNAEGEMIPNEISEASIVRLYKNARYSLVVVSDSIAYFAGLVAEDLTQDARGQTQQILDKANDLMAQVSVSKQDLVSANIWLKDIQNDFGALNEVWESWIDPENPPVRAAVQGALMTPAHLIEIQLTFRFCSESQPLERYVKNSRYSLVVKAADTTHFAGLIADDLEQDIKGQTNQILQKAEELMTQHGLSKQSIVSAMVWLKDIESDFPALNEVWELWVDPENPPVRATVESSLVSQSHLVEIQFTFLTLADDKSIERFGKNARYSLVVKGGKSYALLELLLMI